MDSRDRDILARTIVGEAANQPFEGQQAVAAVVLNRLRSGKYGKTIADVVFAPHQFEPWNTRRSELEAIDPASSAYVSAARAIDAASASDPTGGATHFLQPDIVRQRRGGSLPAWAQGPGTRIGDHVFFAPGSEGIKPAALPTSMPDAATPLPLTPLNSIAAPQNDLPLGTALAALAPAALTFTGSAPQIPPPSDTEIDVSAFQPRTTRRGRFSGDGKSRQNQHA